MVADNHVFCDVRNLVNVIKHSLKDRLLTYLEEWLGKVGCEFAKASGIASCNYDVLHIV